MHAADVAPAGLRSLRAVNVDALAELCAGGRVVVLSGAGCSTESGIPDYRGDGARRRTRPPVQYAAFVRDPLARRRYWARSVLGWPRFSAARPNPAHLALAALERAGVVSGVVTQNVDGLHQAAGSQSVLELHGSLSRVRCLDCRETEARDALQARLLAHNPGFAAADVDFAPDGDAELPDDLIDGFDVVCCRACGGVLKPDVVLFGENVPRAIVDAAWELVDRAGVVLVVGSSLAVFSGFRFVRGAAEKKLPIAIVNLGPTRADALAEVAISAAAGSVLPALASQLAARRVG
jgi:NAD-dependent SIR2 family protein deacetylase